MGRDHTTWNGGSKTEGEEGNSVIFFQKKQLAMTRDA